MAPRHHRFKTTATVHNREKTEWSEIKTLAVERSDFCDFGAVVIGVQFPLGAAVHMTINGLPVSAEYVPCK